MSALVHPSPCLHVLSVPLHTCARLCKLGCSCARFFVLVHASLVASASLCTLVHAWPRVSVHLHACAKLSMLVQSRARWRVWRCSSWFVQATACIGTLVCVPFCTLGHRLYVVGAGTPCSLLPSPTLAGALHVPVPLARPRAPSVHAVPSQGPHLRLRPGAGQAGAVP